MKTSQDDATSTARLLAVDDSNWTDDIQPPVVGTDVLTGWTDVGPLSVASNAAAAALSNSSRTARRNGAPGTATCRSEGNLLFDHSSWRTCFDTHSYRYLVDNHSYADTKNELRRVALARQSAPVRMAQFSESSTTTMKSAGDRTMDVDAELVASLPFLPAVTPYIRDHRRNIGDISRYVTQNVVELDRATDIQRLMFHDVDDDYRRGSSTVFHQLSPVNRSRKPTGLDLLVSGRSSYDGGPRGLKDLEESEAGDDVAVKVPTLSVDAMADHVATNNRTRACLSLQMLPKVLTVRKSTIGTARRAVVERRVVDDCLLESEIAAAAPAPPAAAAAATTTTTITAITTTTTTSSTTTQPSFMSVIDRPCTLLIAVERPDVPMQQPNSIVLPPSSNEEPIKDKDLELNVGKVCELERSCDDWTSGIAAAALTTAPGADVASGPTNATSIATHGVENSSSGDIDSGKQKRKHRKTKSLDRKTSKTEMVQTSTPTGPAPSENQELCCMLRSFAIKGRTFGNKTSGGSVKPPQPEEMHSEGKSSHRVEHGPTLSKDSPRSKNPLNAFRLLTAMDSPTFVITNSFHSAPIGRPRRLSARTFTPKRVRSDSFSDIQSLVSSAAISTTRSGRRKTTDRPL